MGWLWKHAVCKMCVFSHSGFLSVNRSDCLGSGVCERRPWERTEGLYVPDSRKGRSPGQTQATEKVRSKKYLRASNRLSPFPIHQPPCCAPLHHHRLWCAAENWGSATVRSAQPIPLPPTARNILLTRPRCCDWADSVKVSRTLVLSGSEYGHRGTQFYFQGGREGGRGMFREAGGQCLCAAMGEMANSFNASGASSPAIFKRSPATTFAIRHMCSNNRLTWWSKRRRFDLCISRVKS